MSVYALFELREYCSPGVSFCPHKARAVSQKPRSDMANAVSNIDRDYGALPRRFLVTMCRPAALTYSRWHFTH